MKNQISNISFFIVILALIILCLSFILHLQTLGLVSGLSIIFATGLNVFINNTKIS